ncbi:MAG: DUF559 domain-containing protein [Candidatus Margulisbacteria bacterium]|nr:DUF559 domain-containing protein [Candidatus Margulisiibacteriota bacterium]
MKSIFNSLWDKEKRKNLRRNMTESEVIFWNILRKQGISNYKFVRQYSISGFVVDFYCRNLKLAIEIDGSWHDVPGQKEYDRERQKVIEQLGITFVRFTNEQVKNELNHCIKIIKKQINIINRQSLLPCQRGAVRRCIMDGGLRGLSLLLVCFSISLAAPRQNPYSANIILKNSNSVKYKAASYINNAHALTSQKITKQDLKTEYLLGCVAKDGRPYIESIVITASKAYIGDVIPIKFKINEALTSWSIQIEGNRLSGTKFKGREIFAEYKPAQEFFGAVPVKVYLKDLVGYTREAIVTLNLTIESKIDAIKVGTYNYSIQTEVHPGRKSIMPLSFLLSNTNTRNPNAVYLKELIISTNANPVNIDRIFVYKASANTSVLLGITNLPTSNTININLTKPIIISRNPEYYYVYYDLKVNAPVSSNLQFKLLEIGTSRNSRAQLCRTTINILSQVSRIVEKNKPVINYISIPAFVGSTKNITMSVVYEIADIAATNTGLRYNFTLYNYENGKPVLTTGNKLLIKKSSSFVGTGVYRIASEFITPLPLTHNLRYYIAGNVVYAKTGSTCLSNIFKADLTKPVLKIPIKILNLNSIKSQNNNISTNVDINIDLVDITDPESGIKAFRVFRKTNLEPYWKEEFYKNLSVTLNIADLEMESMSEDDISAVLELDTLAKMTTDLPSSSEFESFQINIAGMQTVSLALDMKCKNFLVYEVQNNAGEWSDPCEEFEIDLRQNTALADSLFNVPNPFDSRKENTTIYYTLAENCNVDMSIYSIFGYLVKRWRFMPGENGGKTSNAIPWDGTNELGDKVSKGVYLLVVHAVSASGQSIVIKNKIGVVH